MNDNPVNKAIRSIHFAIVAALLFIALVFSTLYLTLASGLTVETLHFNGVEIRALYIKWDKKLRVDIDSVTLSPGNAKESETPDLQALRDTAARWIRRLDDGWLGRVCVRELRIGDLLAGIEYSPSAPGSLTLRSPGMEADVSLRPVNRQRVLGFDFRARSAELSATFDGRGTLDLPSAVLDVTANGSFAGSVGLRLSLHAGEKSASVEAFSPEPFSSVAPLVTPFHLSREIEQWIVDRAQGGPLMLHTLRTTLPYDDPLRALDNLYAHLTFRNARYYFTPDPKAFEPAVADHVTVVFQNRVLKIVPVDATFYGQSGGSTWLDIDFNPAEPVLSLYLDTTARLTPPLRRLIAAYGIELPFLQTAGETRASLTLRINLQTKNTDAEGTFDIPEGTIDYGGVMIDVNRTRFTLRDADVNITSLDASLFDGRVLATVHGTFNPLKEKGVLHFAVLRAAYESGNTAVTLAPETTPLRFDYIIFPDRDRLRFAPSVWRIKGERIEVSAFDAPFSYRRFQVTLPPTDIRIGTDATLTLSGLIDLKEERLRLKADLRHIRIGGFRNRQTPIPFTVRYDTGNGLDIATAQASRWQSDETEITAGPLQVINTPDRLVLKPTWIRIDKLLQGQIDGILDPQTGTTALTVSHFQFARRGFAELFRKTGSFKVYVVPVEKDFDVIVPSLNMLFSTVDRGWKLHFFSLDALVKSSPLLREYNLTKGDFTIWSRDGEYPYRFKGAIDYPYALLIQDGKPVKAYRFDGMMQAENRAEARVNDAVGIAVGDTISLHSDGVAFNLPEMIRFYEEHRPQNDGNRTGTGERNGLPGRPIRLEAEHTAIVFKDGRKAIADRISVRYENEKIHAELVEGKGGAILEVHRGEFYLFGNNLDDRFMENFFQLSKFKGGSLNFYAAGKPEDFKGLVRIDGTTIRQYVLLNNLFAFINTVPALVTFSLPSYETEGIKIKTAYADLRFRDGNLTVSGLKVDTRELDFTGQGRIDYNRDRIDLTLNVKTQAGENVRKIPVVGYILVGDDKSVMTTFKIEGPIENPKITNTIVRDIIVAPFNILKRTLNFPLHYLEMLEKASPSEKTSAPKRRKKHNPHRITSGVRLDAGKE